MPLNNLHTVSMIVKAGCLLEMAHLVISMRCFVCDFAPIFCRELLIVVVIDTNGIVQFFQSFRVHLYTPFHMFFLGGSCMLLFLVGATISKSKMTKLMLIGYETLCILHKCHKSYFGDAISSKYSSALCLDICNCIMLDHEWTCVANASFDRYRLTCQSLPDNFDGDGAWQLWDDKVKVTTT